MTKKDEFIKEDLEFRLPDSFKGLSKDYILDKIFNKKIQKNWRPQVGDVIVGPTGNIFVIAGKHDTHESLGGNKYFFAPGLCNRDGSFFLNETYSSILNKDGLEYYYGDGGILTRENFYYSSFDSYRYVPYPHEL